MSLCLGKWILDGAGGWPHTQDACALPKEMIMSRPVTKNPRRQQLNLRLTDREFADIQQRAAAFGMRPVHFARTLVTEGTPAVRAIDTHSSPRLVLQLSRLGNNLNQLVRHLHKAGAVMPKDLQPLLTDIRTLIAKARE